MSTISQAFPIAGGPEDSPGAVVGPRRHAQNFGSFFSRKRGPQWPKSEEKIQGSLDTWALRSWHGVTQVQVECQKWHSSRFGPLRGGEKM